MYVEQIYSCIRTHILSILMKRVYLSKGRGLTGWRWYSGYIIILRFTKVTTRTGPSSTKRNSINLPSTLGYFYKSSVRDWYDTISVVLTFVSPRLIFSSQFTFEIRGKQMNMFTPTLKYALSCRETPRHCGTLPQIFGSLICTTLFPIHIIYSFKVCWLMLILRFCNDYSWDPDLHDNWNRDLRFEITRNTQPWAHIYPNRVSQVLKMFLWIHIMPSKKISRPIPLPRKWSWDQEYTETNMGSRGCCLLWKRYSILSYLTCSLIQAKS